MKRKISRLLFYDKGRIVDGHGNTVTPDEARRRWREGMLADWNLAFERLAKYHDFDIAALEAFYARQKAANR